MTIKQLTNFFRNTSSNDLIQRCLPHTSKHWITITHIEYIQKHFPFPKIVDNINTNKYIYIYILHFLINDSLINKFIYKIIFILFSIF
jgi:hypothetical protein